MILRLHDNRGHCHGACRLSAVAHDTAVEAVVARGDVAEVEVADKEVVLAVRGETAAERLDVLEVVIQPVLQSGGIACRELEHAGGIDGALAAALQGHAHIELVEAPGVFRVVAQVKVKGLLAVGTADAQTIPLLVVVVEPVLHNAALRRRALEEHRAGDGGVFAVRLPDAEAELMGAIVKPVGTEAFIDHGFGAAQTDPVPPFEVVIKPVFVFG